MSSIAAIGMDASTGKQLSGLAHIRQSIRDILTTRIGSRVMRRDYGSLLPDLIDQPANAANQLRIMAATVIAIKRWEPRVSISSVALNISVDGRIEVGLDAVLLSGTNISIEGVALR